MTIERPNPMDYVKVVNGEGNATPVHVRFPSGINLTELVEIAPGKSQCVSISKQLAVYHCDFEELDALSKAIAGLVEKWISDGRMCGDTCAAAKRIASNAPMPMGCADCDRVYGPNGFMFRRWEKIR